MSYDASSNFTPDPRPRRRWARRHPILTGLGVLAAIGTIAGIAGGGGSTPHAAITPPAVTAPAPAHHGTASAPTTPPAPAMTASQQQAVTSAQGYLADGQGFSATSLDKQLTSTYGDKFSETDAQFAIRYLHPSWDAQAVIAAKGYLADGQGFSHDGLIQQLTSPYGDAFTQAQAAYGVAKAGL